MRGVWKPNRGPTGKAGARLAAPSPGRIRYARRAHAPWRRARGESRQLPCRRRQVAGGELPAVDAKAADLGGRLQLGRAPRRSTRTPKRSSGSTAWPRKGWVCPTWPKEYGGGGLSNAEARVARRGDAQDPRAPAADQLRHHHARARCCSSTATRSRSASTCPRSSAARSAGARATASRAPAPTSRACRRAPRTRATTTW